MFSSDPKLVRTEKPKVGIDNPANGHDLNGHLYCIYCEISLFISVLTGECVPTIRSPIVELASRMCSASTRDK